MTYQAATLAHLRRRGVPDGRTAQAILARVKAALGEVFDAWEQPADGGVVELTLALCAIQAAGEWGRQNAPEASWLMRFGWVRLGRAGRPRRSRPTPPLQSQGEGKRRGRRWRG